LELGSGDTTKLADLLARNYGKDRSRRQAHSSAGLQVVEFPAASASDEGNIPRSAGPGIDIYSMRQPSASSPALRRFISRR